MMTGDPAPLYSAREAAAALAAGVFPDIMIVFGDLSLCDAAIERLPSQLEVRGDLRLRRSPITMLPARLRVSGNLDLAGTTIEKLPDDLSVVGNLDLIDSMVGGCQTVCQSAATYA